MEKIYFEEKLNSLYDEALNEVKKFFIENGIDKTRVLIPSSMPNAKYIKMMDSEEEETLTYLKYENDKIYFQVQGFDRTWHKAEEIDKENYLVMYNAIFSMLNMNVIDYLKNMMPTIEQIKNNQLTADSPLFTPRERMIIYKLKYPHNLKEIAACIFEKNFNLFINDFKYYGKNNAKSEIKPFICDYYEECLVNTALKHFYSIFKYDCNC